MPPTSAFDPNSANFGRALTQTFIKNGVSQLVAFSTSNILKQVVQSAGTESAKDVAVFGKVFSQAIRQNWRQVIKVHQDVALKGQKAMLRRYDDTHLQTGDQKYRASAPDPYKRYAGGVLRNALASSAMITATLDGVIFGNPEWLDSQARQWARLNFGAGSKAGSRHVTTRDAGPRQFRLPASPVVKFFDAELNLDLGGPRPAWEIPTGIWTSNDPLAGGDFGEGTSPIFTPLGAFKKKINLRGRAVTKRRVSRGLAARGFLESGAASIARNLPVADTAYMLSIFEKSKDQWAATVANKQNIPMGQVNKAVSALEKELETAIARMNRSSRVTAGNVASFSRSF